MPAFRITYCHADGREDTATVSGPSADSVRADYARQHLFVIKIRQVAAPKSDKHLRIESRALARLLRQLELLFASGAPEKDALAALKDRYSDRKIRHVLSSLHASFSSATTTFTEGLRNFPSLLPPQFLAIIATADGQGPEALAARLRHTRETLLFSLRIRKTIAQASIYPAILFAVAIVYIGIFIIYFLPKFIEFIRELVPKLPPTTERIAATAAFLQAHWQLLATSVAGVVVLFALSRKLPRVAFFYDRLILRAPLFGAVQRSIFVSVYCRILHPLIQSGMTTVDATVRAQETVKNRAIRYELAEISKRMSSKVAGGGMSLGASLQLCPYFPGEAATSIAIAEGSGQLAPFLKEVAIEYEEIARDDVEDALAAFKPLMILFIGLIIGVIVISFFKPLSDLYASIS